MINVNNWVELTGGPLLNSGPHRKGARGQIIYKYSAGNLWTVNWDPTCPIVSKELKIFQDDATQLGDHIKPYNIDKVFAPHTPLVLLCDITNSPTSAKKGAKCFYRGLSGVIHGVTNSYGHPAYFLKIEWDKSDPLCGNQQDGGYCPWHFRPLHENLMSLPGEAIIKDSAPVVEKRAYVSRYLTLQEYIEKMEKNSEILSNS